VCCGQGKGVFGETALASESSCSPGLKGDLGCAAELAAVSATAKTCTCLFWLRGVPDLHTCGSCQHPAGFAPRLVPASQAAAGREAPGSRV